MSPFRDVHFASQALCLGPGNGCSRRARFCIAGLWRNAPEVGDAFTMLTSEPGPDVAPYHNRQIVVLPPAEGLRWLDPAAPAREVLKPLPAGSLGVEQVA